MRLNDNAVIAICGSVFLLCCGWGCHLDHAYKIERLKYKCIEKEYKKVEVEK